MTLEFERKNSLENTVVRNTYDNDHINDKNMKIKGQIHYLS